MMKSGSREVEVGCVGQPNTEMTEKTLNSEKLKSTFQFRNTESLDTCCYISHERSFFHTALWRHLCVFLSPVFITCKNIFFTHVPTWKPMWTKLLFFRFMCDNVGLGSYSSSGGAAAFNVCLKSAALTNLLPCFQKCSQITCYSAAGWS